jgi:hypothetical protein
MRRDTIPYGLDRGKKDTQSVLLGWALKALTCTKTLSKKAMARTQGQQQGWVFGALNIGTLEQLGFAFRKASFVLFEKNLCFQIAGK